MAKKSESHKNIHLVAATVFGIVTIVHAIRLGLGLPLILGEVYIPNWLSWLAVFLAGSLSVLLWRSANN